MIQTAVCVVTEDDPTPLVLSVARTLRASSRNPELEPVLRRLHGTVVLRSKDDPQAASLHFEQGDIRVEHGSAPSRDALLVVDLSDRFSLVEVRGSDPERALVKDTFAVLEPPLPAWRDAALAFWEFTRDGRGMPSQLVITCTDDQAELVLGEGSSSYAVGGSAETLARVFTGTDYFLDAVFSGALSIRGSMSQMSVMTGASLKVRFHA